MSKRIRCGNNCINDWLNSPFDNVNGRSVDVRKSNKSFRLVYTMHSV